MNTSLSFLQQSIVVFKQANKKVYVFFVRHFGEIRNPDGQYNE